VSNDIGAAEAVLDLIVRSIVDDPDAVDIEASEKDDALRLDVRVGDGDMGRVIGKRGRMANAIRTVVAAAAASDGDEEVEVEFIDQ
jgi:predicted RNA-binding protein YlqC (UPF0109 family)